LKSENPQNDKSSNKPITSPLKAIRAHCLDCVGGMASEVRKCTGPLLIGQKGICALHPYRFGKGRKSGVKAKLSPVKAIAKNCLWCCGGSARERKLCPSQICHLKPFRFGKNPFVSEKRREASQKAMSLIREKAKNAG